MCVHRFNRTRCTSTCYGVWFSLLIRYLSLAIQIMINSTPKKKLIRDTEKKHISIILRLIFLSLSIYERCSSCGTQVIKIYSIQIVNMEKYALTDVQKKNISTDSCLTLTSNPTVQPVFFFVDFFVTLTHCRVPHTHCVVWLLPSTYRHQRKKWTVLFAAQEF